MMQRLEKLLKRWVQPQPEVQNYSWEPRPTSIQPASVSLHDGPLLRPMPSTDTQKMRIYKAMDMSG